jgi:hypothetical protein
MLFHTDDYVENEDPGVADEPQADPIFHMDDVGADWEDYAVDLSSHDRSRNILEGGNFQCFPCQVETGEGMEREMKNILFQKPLYKDATFSLQDFAKGILLLRLKYQRSMGDDMMAGIAGFISSILPKSNACQQYIKSFGGTNTKYHVQKMVFESSGLSGSSQLTTAQIDVCENGCYPFCGQSSDSFICPVCYIPRYKSCRPHCVSRDGSLICDHARVPRRTMYYMTIRDRVSYLLNGDFGRLFDYPKDRNFPMEGYVDDVYDGTGWKAFENELSPGEELIGIQACTDGADMFNFSGNVREALRSVLKRFHINNNMILYL